MKIATGSGSLVLGVVLACLGQTQAFITPAVTGEFAS